MTIETLRRITRWLLGQPEPPTLCNACHRGIHTHDMHSGQCVYAKAGCECPVGGGRS